MPLPSGLAPRAEHEMDQAKDYWLLRALDLRPGHLGALMAYAQYLRPRWGGSYEDIDGMAGGPLCAALSEPQRNAIRWIGILDSMGDYPEPDDAEAVAEYREMFESFLQRELRPESAAWRWVFTRSSSAIRWRIRSRRARCTHRARRHFRRTAISATWTGRSAASRTSASSTACRTTTAPSRASWNACAIGIPWLRRRPGGGGPSLRPLGFRAGPGARAAQLLDRAAVLAQDQADDDFNVLAAAAMLWDGGDHEQGYFLTRQLADRRVADAASSMYDIHRGFRDNTPDSYLDDAVRDQWLQRAVEEGSPLAMYNMAYRNIFEDELDFAPREPGQGSAPASAHARSRAPTRWRGCASACCCATTAPSRNSRKACAPICVRWWTRITTARARAEIALAHAHGRGARKNRFAAIEWAQHASRLQPDDEGIDEIQSQVLNSHSLVKTIGTVFGAYMGRGGISAEDLPPKPDAQ